MLKRVKVTPISTETALQTPLRMAMDLRLHLREKDGGLLLLVTLNETQIQNRKMNRLSHQPEATSVPLVRKVDESAFVDKYLYTHFFLYLFWEVSLLILNFVVLLSVSQTCSTRILVCY